MDGNRSLTSNVAPKPTGKVSENKFVRTDSKLRTLDHFLHTPSIISKPTPSAANEPLESEFVDSPEVVMRDVDEDVTEVVAETQYV